MSSEQHTQYRRPVHAPGGMQFSTRLGADRQLSPEPRPLRCSKLKAQGSKLVLLVVLVSVGCSDSESTSSGGSLDQGTDSSVTDLSATDTGTSDGADSQAADSQVGTDVPTNEDVALEDAVADLGEDVIDLDTLDTTSEDLGDVELDTGSTNLDDLGIEVGLDASADLGDSADEGDLADIPPEPVPLVFSAMGDVPYAVEDLATLQADIVSHNSLSSARFVVHVGDIKGGGAPCLESVYQTVSAALLELVAPTFIIPGDNEWNDCADPDEAWTFWVTYFSRFDLNWESAPAVSRQEARDENFAWIEEDVLIIGINLVGGAVHDAEEWSTRLGQDATWVEAQMSAAPERVYAAVVFGHANPNANHAVFIDRFKLAVSDFDRPVLFIHGDGHVWIDDVPWEGLDLRRIQVDAGGGAPPLEVTVTPGGEGSVFAVERSQFGE